MKHEAYEALRKFSDPVRSWFIREFGEPTPPQEKGWPPIQRGEHTLILSPTGSGKTLAAFLWGIDRILSELADSWFDELRLVYVSPLKALNNDIERNLRIPLRGIREAARRAGSDLPRPRVAVRSGDTPPRERRTMYTRPPHILITTPESLYIMLTHPRARELFGSVRTVIVDEIHALAGNKRGVHLALSLERLENLAKRPVQRIGLSATIRPLEAVAHFLGGNDWVTTDDGTELNPRPVTIVDASYDKPLDLLVETVVDDPSEQPGHGLWLPLLERLAQLVRQHETTLVFANNRRTAERIAERLNEILTSEEGIEAILADGVPKGQGYFAASTGSTARVVGVHHGSLSREKRLQTEADLKTGSLKAIVGTSSLELGIDIGTIDLVVQVDTPKSVTQGLQRIGRSGHLVGMTSKGRLFPLHPESAMEAAVIASGILEREVESTHVPRNPLDVLAQQIVAMVSVEDWDADELFRLVRQCAAYESLSRRLFDRVLEMLSGRYRTPLHRELRPRILWNRANNRLRSLPGSRTLALVNGGTIPDQGTYGAYLPDGKTRIGELDEEFVFETRVGDTFLLGSQVWRVLEISDDRLIVTEAPGSMARMPFWRGDYPWRPYETGRRVGAFRRQLAQALRSLKIEIGCSKYTEILQHLDATPVQNLLQQLRSQCALDRGAALSILRYLAKQLDEYGIVATDKTVIFEVFEDALGDLRLVVHSPFGGRVNGPWGLVIASVLRERLGIEVEMVTDDDGILIRLPPLETDPPLAPLRELDPEEARERLLSDLPHSAVFGARFRQNAARALLLPGTKGKKRTPFWLQRLKAKDLLEAVRNHSDFPILLETVRDCLEEVMDLEHLLEVLRGIRAGEIQTAVVRATRPSALARGMMWGFANIYLYEWDKPKGQQGESGRPLDRDLLESLLSTDELIRSLHPDAVETVRRQTQGLGHSGRVRTHAELNLLFQRFGDLREDEALSQLPPEQHHWLRELAQEGTIVEMMIPTSRGPESRWVLREYESEYRRAFGPEGEESARRRILERFLGSTGPVSVEEIRERYDFPLGWLRQTLDDALARGELLSGEFPLAKAPPAIRYCRRDLVREMHRYSVAILRKEVEAVSPTTYVEFLVRWQHVHPGARARDLSRLEQILDRLQALPLPLQTWLRDVLPIRIPTIHPEGLDELIREGQILWVARGDQPEVAFLSRLDVPFILPDESGTSENLSDAERRVLDFLRSAGASFLMEIVRATGLTETAVDRALRSLVLRGLVTNDSFSVLREIARTAAPPWDDVDSGRFGRVASPFVSSPFVYRGGLTRAAYREAKRRARRKAMLQARALSGSGRWSVIRRGESISHEDRALYWARILLKRYGVVAREWIQHEPFAPDVRSVWAALRLLELRGEVRGGYFVRGLAGGQFALPEVADRLRDPRDSAQERGFEEPVVLSALDPISGVLQALGRGSGMGFDESVPNFVRRPSTWITLWNGKVVLVAQDWGRRLFSPLALGDPAIGVALQALLTHLSGVVRRVSVELWNGRPVLDSEACAILRELGFFREATRMTWQRPAV